MVRSSFLSHLFFLFTLPQRSHALCCYFRRYKVSLIVLRCLSLSLFSTFLSNDGLPVCDSSCWKRTDYLEDEWPCFRNSMDTRCPAMLEGPYRRSRGIQYMKYLETFYNKPTHKLIIVPDMGHNATGMFGSDMGLDVIFG